MQPGDPVVGGTVLRRVAIQSPNFVHLVSGWSINQDGTAEFHGLVVVGGVIVGPIIQGGQFQLTDGAGTVVGTLDGDSGLVLYGAGDAANPELTITPDSDLVWANFDANAVTPNAIEVGNTEVEIIAGTDTGDSQGAALVVNTHTSGADTPGVQVWQWLYGNDQGGSGSPVPQVEVWHTPVPANGGTTPLADPFRYRVDAGGWVHLEGELDGGTLTSGTILFTLGSGYEPPIERRIPAVAQNSAGSTFGTWTVRILTDGTIRTLAPPAGLTTLRFDGVAFALLP
jgi:hypothetical protein